MPKKILVIEDEAEMLNLVRYTLNRAGYEVSTCENGGQAWDMLLKEKPDLLILDVMLPKVDGYALQLKISENEQTKSIPTIVITALEPSRKLFKKFSQVADFMVKPFKTDALVESVEKAIGKAESVKPA